MIDWWLNDDWMMIDWLVIDWWLFDDWLIDDLLMINWWLIGWWLIDDWLMTDWWLMGWPYHSFDCVSFSEQLSFKICAKDQKIYNTGIPNSYSD